MKISFKQVDKDKKFVLGYLDAQVFNNPTQSKSWTDTVVRKKKTTSGNEDALGLQNAFFPTASAVEDADSLARENTHIFCRRSVTAYFAYAHGHCRACIVRPFSVTVTGGPHPCPVN